jgi:hypothetical protein
MEIDFLVNDYIQIVINKKICCQVVVYFILGKIELQRKWGCPMKKKLKMSEKYNNLPGK